MTSPYRLGTDLGTDPSTDSLHRLPPPTPTYVRTNEELTTLRGKLMFRNARVARAKT